MSVADIDLSRLRVLVADGGAYSRALTRSSLMALGVKTVAEADGGPQAETLLRAGDADLLIADIDFSGPHGGLELLSAIRGSGAGCRIDLPVIIIAQTDDAAVVTEARRRGVNEFLITPLTAESLFRRIRAVVTAPRPFVQSPVYVGPCRRSVERRIPESAERRINPPPPRPDPLIEAPTGTPRRLAAQAPQPHSSRKRFRAGATIFQEGEAGLEAYIVESGSVLIQKTVGGQPVLLGSVGVAGVFGEMALIDNEPRMASAVAAEDTVCLVMPKAALRGDIRKSPDLVVLVLETLLKNIRGMGHELAEARAGLAAMRQGKTLR